MKQTIRGDCLEGRARSNSSPSYLHLLFLQVLFERLADPDFCSLVDLGHPEAAPAHSALPDVAPEEDNWVCLHRNAYVQVKFCSIVIVTDSKLKIVIVTDSKLKMLYLHVM